MNKEEKHLLNIKFMYEYYKDNIFDRYVKNLSDNIILDNDCLDIEGLERIYVIPFKKHKQLEQENQQLKEEIKGYQQMYFDKVMIINKAIEYINDNVAVYAFNNKDLPHWEFNDDDMEGLLEILKGGSNE